MLRGYPLARYAIAFIALYRDETRIAMKRDSGISAHNLADAELDTTEYHTMNANITLAITATLQTQHARYPHAQN